MKPLLAALYIRIADPEKGQDPDQQFLHLRKYANSRGFQIYCEYVDYGASGGKGRGRVDEIQEGQKQRLILREPRNFGLKDWDIGKLPIHSEQKPQRFMIF